jgi:hypothetical protein
MTAVDSKLALDRSTVVLNFGLLGSRDGYIVM